MIRQNAWLASSLLLLTALGSSACSSSSNATSGSGGSGAASASSGATGPSSSSGTGGSSSQSSSGSSGTGGAQNGDTFGPFFGGASYYAQWSHGPPSDASFFPIAVWLQDPSNADAYKAIGINTFIGLWQGPTDQQLTDLASSKMAVACDQNSVGLAHKDDATILAWTQDDEPDNAQSDGNGGYGPCVPASTIQGRYQDMVSKDATRPVFLNLGQGVAHDYIGWGSQCAMTHPADYVDYVKGADIVSFDIYPMNETDAPVAGHPEYVAKGVDNLMQWSAGKKAVWNWIECTGISGPAGKPTPEVVKAEVWMSIVHGSNGVGYFVHQFQPSFDEHALLDDPAMKAAVTAINARVQALAPALNTPPVTNGGKVTSSDAAVPVDMRLVRQGGATYIFAVAMAKGGAHATFSALTNLPSGAKVVVLDESREIALSNAGFEDDFGDYGVHLYKIQ